jgi:hypothetical protein
VPRPAVLPVEVRRAREAGGPAAKERAEKRAERKVPLPVVNELRRCSRAAPEATRPTSRRTRTPLLPPPAGRPLGTQADRLNGDFTYVHRTNPAASRAAKEARLRWPRAACLEYALNPTVPPRRGSTPLCDELGVDVGRAGGEAHRRPTPPPPPPRGARSPAPPKKKPPAKKGAGEKDAKPYAYTVTVHRGGNQRQFDVVAPSVGTPAGGPAPAQGRGADRQPGPDDGGRVPAGARGEA